MVIPAVKIEMPSVDWCHLGTDVSVTLPSSWNGSWDLDEV